MSVIKRLLPVVVTLCSAISTGIAQEQYDKTFDYEADRRGEIIWLFTDRNMYTVNEKILFRSFYKGPSMPGGNIYSRVLYVELVTPEGRTVSGGKFLNEVSGSSGSLDIQGETITGNYYLRAYTKWMRNFGPASFAYVPLKIINPFSAKVVSNDYKDQEKRAEWQRMDKLSVEYVISNKSYNPGEEVSVEISTAKSREDFPGGFCISVAKSGLLDTITGGVLSSSGNSQNFLFNHMPEPNGISISGSMIRKDDRSPVAKSPLHFSILKDQPAYLVTVTDDEGRFLLSIPDKEGIQEIFVASAPLEKFETEILIDQDFSGDEVPFVTPQFVLSEGDLTLATGLALNMQLSEEYGIAGTKISTGPERDSILPFYGTPYLRVNTEEFIKLPTMIEVFENIVPGVQVHYHRGEPYFEIESISNNISLFPPLILIDRIPVFDQKAVLSVDPARIERIDVINDVYVRGEAMFGGIINLTSIKGDMAAVDLPEGSYFFDYRAYQAREDSFKSTGSQSPVATPDNLQGRIPDTRNTIFWTARLDLMPGEKTNVSFRAPRDPGIYRVLIRGVSSAGEIKFYTGSFEVK